MPKKRKLAEVQQTDVDDTVSSSSAAAASASVSHRNETDSDEKKEDSSSAVQIDPDAKGEEAWSAYVKAMLESEPMKRDKRVFFPMTSTQEFLQMVYPEKEDELDYMFDGDAEDEIDKLYNDIPLRTFINRMEYLFVNQKCKHALDDIQEIFLKVHRSGSDDDDNRFVFSYENTHTGNCKAFELERVMKRMNTMWRKKDFESVFAYALAITFLTLDRDDYWMHDNECWEEIDENIMKPLAKYWSKLLEKPCTEFGCVDDTNDRRSLLSYLTRVKKKIATTDCPEYEYFKPKLHAKAKDTSSSAQPPRKKRRTKK